MGIRKLLVLLVILLLCVSCKRKPSEPCIIDCYVESDSVVICLNNQYKIGYIFGGAVGELWFAEGLTDNYKITKDEKITTIIIKNNDCIFKEGNDYRIGVEWSGGGSVETWSTFKNTKFISFGNEKYDFKWK